MEPPSVIPVATAFARVPAPRVQRSLRIDEYTRAQSGVWYYQVDIELRSPVRPANVGGSACLDACDEEDVQSYSVRRRYNEFAQLYDKIKEEIVAASPDPTHAIGDSGLPPFPQKELISSSVLGLLWRVSGPRKYVLEERRAKFEALLRWIEYHPTLRQCAAYVDFLGQPPQVSEGYVSLKEYTSQNWLSSLEKLTKEKEKRRRRLSSDCTALHTEPLRRTKKRRQDDADASPAKRARRRAEPTTPKARSPAAAPRRQKRTRGFSTSDDKAASSGRQLLLASGDADAVAQVESSHKPKKKKMQ